MKKLLVRIIIFIILANLYNAQFKTIKRNKNKATICKQTHNKLKSRIHLPLNR
jgi:hypothetical protein